MPRVARNDIEGYLTGAAAAIIGDATAFPIDTVKVRMQQRAGCLRSTVSAVVNGGMGSMYKGVNASAFRQATYGG